MVGLIIYAKPRPNLALRYIKGSYISSLFVRIFREKEKLFCLMVRSSESS